MSNFNNKGVIKATVDGLWHASDRIVGDTIFDHWKEGFINSEIDSYIVKDVLSTYPELAELWLQKHAFDFASDTDSKLGVMRLEESVRAAVNCLSDSAKKRVINQINSTPYAVYIVAPLVGNDINLYQDLLRKSKQKKLHLLPLYGAPRKDWANKAKVALDFGYSHQEIAGAMRWHIYQVVSGSGNESKMWSDWIRQLEPYANHEDEAIRKIIMIAINEAKRRMNEALIEERKEDVFGRE